MKFLNLAVATIAVAVASPSLGSNKVLQLGTAQSAANAGTSSAWASPNQSGAMTVEFWLRMEPETQSQSQFGRPFSLRGCSCGGITLNAHAEGAAGRLEIELGTIDAWSAASFSLSKWHHFAIIWSRSGREVRLYVDGVLANQRTIPAGTSIQICGDAELRMGEQCGRGVVGAIDNVRYWSIERTVAQLVADMSRQYSTAEAQSAAGLIGSWSFENGTVFNAAGSTPAGALEASAVIVNEPLLPGCNSDGIVDYGQILDGTLSDVNDDGVPDSCQAPCAPSDLNNDGAVDGSDLGALLSDWGPAAGQGTRADINGDGIVNGADLGTLLANWGPCGAAPAWATVIQWQPDPAVVTDGQFRAGIQATGLPWRVRDTGTGIELLLVPPGTFEMGCSMRSDLFECLDHERPAHHVTLTNAFYVGRYEVTQAQWTAKMGSNPSSFQSASAQVPAAQVPNRPVERVSWFTIQGYLSATGMRLPTEAEWEYTCRAGTQTPFHNGSTDDGAIGDMAWYGACCAGNSSEQTHPVGGKVANSLGFHDMHGNVFEWVQDGERVYTSTPQQNPIGPAPSHAVTVVARGGSWYDDSSAARSSYRARGWPDLALGVIGFRVARTP